MKKIFKKFFCKAWRKVWFIATCALLVIMYVASIVLTQNEFLSGTMDTVFAPGERTLVSGDPSTLKHFKTDEGITDKAGALAYGNSVNEEITAEGFTLLKNADDALPFNYGSKIHVFGQNSVNIVYGGSGSGGMDASKAISVSDSLKQAGFTVNEKLVELYKNSRYGRPASPAISAASYYLPGFATGEAPISVYTDAIKSSFTRTDPAIVVFSRVGGESYDLPRTSYNKVRNAPSGAVEGAANETDHYLQLDKNETDLLNMVCDCFDTVVAVLNSSATLELGALEDNDKLDGILWIGNPGGTGIKSLGKIFNGEISPSGRTVDTYARNFKLDPSYQNISDFSQFYDGTRQHNTFIVDGKNATTTARFVEYEESIYVGYRYYETRGFTEAQAGNDGWYDNNVVYPFGYGLSYSDDLDWQVSAVRVNGAACADISDIGAIDAHSKIEIDVKVTNPATNSFDKPVKDVVELYFSAPYYDGGIEKSHVVLADFAKTKALEKGASDTVTLTVTGFEMASFDYNDKNADGHSGYELEGGTYRIMVASNAHDAANKAAASINGLADADAVTATVSTTVKVDTDPTNGKDISVKFSDVSAHFNAGSKSSLMSRSNFAGTFPTHPTDETRTVDQSFIDTLKPVLTEKESDPWYSATAPKQAANALPQNKATQLYEMMGLDYNDQKWNAFLDQLTLNQLLTLVGTGNFNTAALDNIGKPRTMEPDGPAGYTNFMSVGEAPVYDTTFYASECVIGATWSKELVHKMGVAVGNESIIGNERGDGTTYSGWYAPAMNIHRSQFSGRNFEYYSEDGVLSGKIAAEVVKGAAEKGVYTYLKHFALNDQEADRDTYGGLVTWASEQAMREIYFKPFEIAVKDGKSKGVMSSFNRIGTVWAGGHYNLLTGVLRNEWGFTGSVVTDYILEDGSANVYKFNVTQMLNAGGDIVLNQSWRPKSDTPTEKANLRRAAHNILYVTANSNAMNGYGAGVVYRTKMAGWKVVLIIVVVSLSVVILGLDALFMVLANKNISDEQLEELLAKKQAKKNKKAKTTNSAE